MNLPNIALVGLRGAGKDTVANALIAEHRYTKMSWADPVRQIAAMAYDPRFVGGPEDYAAAKAAKFTIRNANGTTERITGTQVLQRIGTDAIRDHLDMDFWIKAGLRRIEESEVEEFGYHWVNTDTRFPNEADALRSKGWVIVGLHCPDAIRQARLIARDGFYDEAASTHSSEKSLTLDDCDLTVSTVAPTDKVIEHLLDLVEAAA